MINLRKTAAKVFKKRMSVYPRTSQSRQTHLGKVDGSGKNADVSTIRTDMWSVTADPKTAETASKNVRIR